MSLTQGSGAPQDAGSKPLQGDFLLNALESGEARAARRGEDGRWVVDASVKEGILDVFRTSPVIIPYNELQPNDLMGTHIRSNPFRDKSMLTIRRFTEGSKVRIVPGGTSIRRGSHLGLGVVVMPPSYVNVGAFVGAESMIDSHVLVGSCAQIGQRVHLSAGVQIGGVLEPANARPVIVEDDAFIGGNCGIYEGVLVRQGAVLASGVILASGTVVYDLENQREIRGTREDPLEIPERAVVVPGSRPVSSGWGKERGLHAACALIVKYRDEKTDRATALEAALR
jgi:2,3,4,5-tetrahydropyridine-2-carboxylate N-succinyltransferase